MTINYNTYNTYAYYHITFFFIINRSLVPVPQLLDTDLPDPDAYKKRSITPWKNQVKKYVHFKLGLQVLNCTI